MSTTLAALVAILQSEVPAVNSVPTSAQYEQAVKDAVREFSRRCGRAKMSSLSIVNGTASYTLPSDFLSLIWLEAVSGIDGVIIASTGIIPTDADWQEVYTIQGDQITFTPTPTFSMTREYKYKAAWVLSGSAGSETYATMGEDEAQIVLLKAKGIALEKLANALASAGGMKYSLGAVSVDKGGSAESMTNRMYKLHGEFLDACKAYNGAVMYGL